MNFFKIAASLNRNEIIKVNKRHIDKLRKVLFGMEIYTTKISDNELELDIVIVNEVNAIDIASRYSIDKSKPKPKIKTEPLSKPKIVRNMTYYRHRLLTTGKVIVYGSKNYYTLFKWLGDYGVQVLSVDSETKRGNLPVYTIVIEVTDKTIEMAKDYAPLTSFVSCKSKRDRSDRVRKNIKKVRDPYEHMYTAEYLASRNKM